MMSVPEAAERLGVSAARVRQRIQEGSLVAEKVGGRWLVDLDASSASVPQRGRPVSRSSVWWSLLSADLARALADDDVRKQLDHADNVNEPRSSWAAQLAVALAPKMHFGDVIFPSLLTFLSPEASKVSKAALPRERSVPEAALLDVSAISHAVLPAIDNVSRSIDGARPPQPRLSEIAEAVLPLRMTLADAILAARHDQLRARESQPDLRIGDLSIEVKRLSPSSRHRIVRRFISAVEDNDHEAILAWLRNRGDRRVFRAADRDVDPLRHDDRILLSGISHPDSQMQDLRIVEGYVRDADLPSLVADHWLEDLKVGDRPNVILHVAPLRPSAVSPLMLAADLAEHGGPREVKRAHELLDEAIDDLVHTEHGREAS